MQGQKMAVWLACTYEAFKSVFDKVPEIEKQLADEVLEEMLLGDHDHDLLVFFGAEQVTKKKNKKKWSWDKAPLKRPSGGAAKGLTDMWPKLIKLLKQSPPEGNWLKKLHPEKYPESDDNAADGEDGSEVNHI